MALVPPSELFAEREQLFISMLRKQLVWRHGNTSLRKHIRSHIEAIRSIRGARDAYADGLSNRRLRPLNQGH